MQIINVSIKKNWWPIKKQVRKTFFFKWWNDNVSYGNKFIIVINIGISGTLFWHCNCWNWWVVTGWGVRKKKVRQREREKERDTAEKKIRSFEANRFKFNATISNKSFISFFFATVWFISFSLYQMIKGHFKQLIWMQTNKHSLDILIVCYLLSRMRNICFNATCLNDDQWSVYSNLFALISFFFKCWSFFPCVTLRIQDIQIFAIISLNYFAPFYRQISMCLSQKACVQRLLIQSKCQTNFFKRNRK